MDINIKIEFPEKFYSSVNALAVAIAGSMELILEGPCSRAKNEIAAAACEEARKQEDAISGEANPPVNEQPEIKLEDVRAKLAALSQGGKQAEVKALLVTFGAKKLTEIPKERFAEVLKAAEAL